MNWNIFPFANLFSEVRDQGNNSTSTSLPSKMQSKGENVKQKIKKCQKPRKMKISSKKAPHVPIRVPSPVLFGSLYEKEISVIKNHNYFTDNLMANSQLTQSLDLTLHNSSQQQFPPQTNFGLNAGIYSPQFGFDQAPPIVNKHRDTWNLDPSLMQMHETAHQQHTVTAQPTHETPANSSSQLNSTNNYEISQHLTVQNLEGSSSETVKNIPSHNLQGQNLHKLSMEIVKLNGGESLPTQVSERINKNVTNRFLVTIDYLPPEPISAPPVPEFPVTKKPNIGKPLRSSIDFDIRDELMRNNCEISIPHSPPCDPIRETSDQVVLLEDSSNMIQEEHSEKSQTNFGIGMIPEEGMEEESNGDQLQEKDLSLAPKKQRKRKCWFDQLTIEGWNEPYEKRVKETPDYAKIEMGPVFEDDAYFNKIKNLKKRRYKMINRLMLKKTMKSYS